MPSSSNAPRRTLLLTGASRGIGHATAIRFSSAGWRVITCSRHAFPEVCPWGAGPEDHIEVDLADHADTTRAISEIRKRLENDELQDRKSTRLNSSHTVISYAVFCLKKKKKT